MAKQRKRMSSNMLAGLILAAVALSCLIFVGVSDVRDKKRELQYSMESRGGFFEEYVNSFLGKDRDKLGVANFWVLYNAFSNELDRKKEFYGVICYYDEHKQPIVYAGTYFGRPRNRAALADMANEVLNGNSIETKPMRVIHSGVCLVETDPPFYIAYVMEAFPLRAAWNDFKMDHLPMFFFIFLGNAIGSWLRKRKDKKSLEDKGVTP